jgi:Rieske Fe-S protein
MLKKLAVLSLFLFVFLTVAQAQQDPFVGTWKQNVAKSKYNPGPPPAQGNMHKIEAVPNGIKVTTTGTVNAQGQASSNAWTATYDGKDSPMNDTSGTYDAISLKKTGPRSLEASSKKGGKVLRTSQWSVSADGKTLTRTAKTTDAQGKVHNDVLVYDKQ